MPQLPGRPDSMGRSIEVEIVTRASADKVWQAWTEPARNEEWFSEVASGAVLAGSQVSWSFMRIPAEMKFRVVDARPGERLLLVGCGEIPGTVEVLISTAHDGTRVRLIHSGLPSTADFDSDFSTVTSGWRLALAILGYYTEFHFGRPRQGFLVWRRSRFPAARLARLYRDPAGLQEWLADGGSLGTPGGRVHLALKSGETLRGDMLADTGTEIAMAWDEIEGVLQLKTFPLPEEPGLRAICIWGWGWGLSSERARRIEKDMGEALERLDRVLEGSEIRQAALPLQRG